MKTTTIITAKIEPDIYKMIDEGRKNYEVRDESFQNADVIRYVDNTNGKVLGMYWLGPESVFDYSPDQFMLSLFGIDDDRFHRLFPKTGINLHTARICSRTSLTDIFPEVEA